MLREKTIRGHLYLCNEVMLAISNNANSIFNLNIITLTKQLTYTKKILVTTRNILKINDALLRPVLYYNVDIDLLITGTFA